MIVLVSCMFNYFYISKNHEIANNSTTIEAKEKHKRRFGIFRVLELFDVCSTKLKNNQISFDKISRQYPVMTKLNAGLNIPIEPLFWENLLKGKDQYSWPPCTNLFRSVPFYIENIINIFNKTSNLNEEVNCTEPSPSVSIPCPIGLWVLATHITNKSS